MHVLIVRACYHTEGRTRAFVVGLCIHAEKHVMHTESHIQTRYTYAYLVAHATNEIRLPYRNAHSLAEEARLIIAALTDGSIANDYELQLGSVASEIRVSERRCT